MIDFNRENLSEELPEDEKSMLEQELQENLKMQTDCELYLASLQKTGEPQEIKLVQETLKTLKAAEKQIRKDLEG